MRIVKQKETRRVDTSPNSSIEEYLMPETRVSGATAIISGRYPEKGYVTNLVSYELVLVLSGDGFIGIKNKKEVSIELGNCILIRPKEKYYWKGYMALFIVCTPTWRKRQHVLVT